MGESLFELESAVPNEMKLMKTVVQKLATFAKEKEREGRQGAALVVVGADGQELFADVTLFDGGAHSEMVLLKDHGPLRALAASMRKVYLFSLFAPCNGCTEFLKSLPRTYSQAAFSLAFKALTYQGAPYSDDDATRWLLELVGNGWKARQWSSGQYRPPEKRTSEAEKAIFTPPPGTDTFYGSEAMLEYMKSQDA
jgi:hypothetical protein